MKPARPHLVLISLAIALVLAVSATVLLFLASRASGPGPSAESYAYRPQASGELPTLWKVPEFTFRDQTGAARSRADLEGHVWIADFIFTTCTTVCPMISAQMVLLQHRLKDAELRFVSFSVDPDHDTPQALAEYARTWNRAETRWILLSTDPKGLAATAAGMRVAVEPSGDEKDPILHTRLFFLVDPRGNVRGVYDSGDEDALVRLTQDARSLLGGASESRGEVAPDATGEALFMALGCAACHDDAKLAPPLGGLAGRSVMLEGGGSVTADGGYIEESIVAPGSKRVAGYLNLMPSYARELSPAQLQRLVKYVERLPATGTLGGPTHATMAIDPVCHMQVRATDTTLHVEHAGHTYYFCADGCRERFLQDPAKYLEK